MRFLAVPAFEFYAHVPLTAEADADGTTELISDLAIASFGPSVELESVCPHHGRTCKKGLCDWRAKYEKKKERERGYPKGPSNTKNYNQRPNHSRCCLSRTLVFFSSCCHEVVVGEASQMAATAAGLRQKRHRQPRVQRPSSPVVLAVSAVVQPLPPRVMPGVAGHPHSLLIDHRRRRLVRGTELAAGDNLSGLQLVVAGRPKMPAVVYS